MCLLQHTDERGYKTTEDFHISADKGRNFGTKNKKADGQGEIDERLGPTWTH
jgi:hypothetical protein